MGDLQPDEIAAVLRAQFTDLKTQGEFEEVGTVLQVGDGVVYIYGLTQVQAGELIEFQNGTKALALNLEEHGVGAVILNNTTDIKEGDTVKRTKKVASIEVGEGLIGRVVNTLGEPMDGKGPIKGELFSMPLERKAPGVIYRQPVTEPLQTGIRSIDAMIPIGRGQRELIIGDKQTGKTTIAVDAIINQRTFFEQGKPVYCIYVAIGQKSSTIANLVADLYKYGAMDYTAVVIAPASVSAPLQYLAPFAGVTIGEYFRDTGRPVLIVYDDLSKQAVAYREISLLLKRPPGREAYPGDVFYLHSRLLERAANINTSDTIAQQMNDIPISLIGKIRGGGSLTALPIIETQDGDVSAYIPTNVISITDGQIFLESTLFNAGIRPAVNVGISVSRVGGAAQSKAMKKVAGMLKLAQAQFHDLEAFSKFGSELDPSTKKIIERGYRNQEVLKQNNHEPTPLGEQIAILFASINGYLDHIAITQVKKFEVSYLALLKSQHSHILQRLSNGEWEQDIEMVLAKEAKELSNLYKTHTK
jgi:F-type H+-transporting ATPase subunit alpha